MVKSDLNFCYCAVDQEKKRFLKETGRSGPSAFLGPEMARKGQNLSGSSQETARICLGAPRNQPELVWDSQKNQNLSGRERRMLRISLGEATKKRPFFGPCKGSSGWRAVQACPTFRFRRSGSSQNWSGFARRFLAERCTLGPPARRGCSKRVPETREQKCLGLGSLPLHLRGRAPSGRHGGGSRPALPGLHDGEARAASGSAWRLSSPQLRL